MPRILRRQRYGEGVDTNRHKPLTISVLEPFTDRWLSHCLQVR